MVISSFISSILVLALGVWAFARLEHTMNNFTERQLLIEPDKFSYKMWKDMPVTMYQSFTFFNLTNWAQVKAIGQKPRFVEVGPYVYRTIWTKSDIKFQDEDKSVSFAERKQWIFEPKLSQGSEADQIWTINTPLMTALALIQNAPVITRNIVSVILDGLGEGAFIKRPIKSLLFEGYSDLIVSVGPLFDRRFSLFNGKFAYLYNKNDSIDGTWTVSTGLNDVSSLNKITRFQSNIVNMTNSNSPSTPPQGLNEVKSECASAWSLDQATNGQLFAPFNKETLEQMQNLQLKLQQQSQSKAAIRGQSRNTNELQQSIGQTALIAPVTQRAPSMSESLSRRLFGVGASATTSSTPSPSAEQLIQNPFIRAASSPVTHATHKQATIGAEPAHKLAPASRIGAPADAAAALRDTGKYIFYPDLCRPLHLLPGKKTITSKNGISATRFFIDPRVFMNSTQAPANKCFEMNPRPPLANALAATINSVTGANVAVPNLVSSASSPFAMFMSSPSHQAESSGGFGSHIGAALGAGLFERANHPSSFLNNALHNLGAAAANVGFVPPSLGLPAAAAAAAAAAQAPPASPLQALAQTQSGNNLGASSMGDQLAASASNLVAGTPNGANNAPVSRLGRVRQLFSNIVSQRMSAAAPLLPSLTSGPAAMLMGSANHNAHAHSMQPSARSAFADMPSLLSPVARQQSQQSSAAAAADLMGASAAGSQQGLSQQVRDPSHGGASLRAAPADIGPSAGLNEGPTTTSVPLTSPVAPLVTGLPPPPPPPLPPSQSGGHLQAGSGLLHNAAQSHSERWVTQFRFKWPRGVFSIGQCQLGAPIYASLPHFLDADEYYLEQVDGLRPNRSLHEFYIDIESTLHSIPVNAKARLQLNVATPELKFRNIPNAMIPVLWQEVTFEIDKPVATMLYWSFTMSSTLYRLLSIALIAIGLALLVASFYGSLRKQVASRRSSSGSDISIADNHLHDCHGNSSVDTIDDAHHLNGCCQPTTRASSSAAAAAARDCAANPSARCSSTLYKGTGALKRAVAGCCGRSDASRHSDDNQDRGQQRHGLEGLRSSWRSFMIRASNDIGSSKWAQPSAMLSRDTINHAKFDQLTRVPTCANVMHHRQLPFGADAQAHCNDAYETTSIEANFIEHSTKAGKLSHGLCSSTVLAARRGLISRVKDDNNNITCNNSQTTTTNNNNHRPGDSSDTSLALSIRSCDGASSTKQPSSRASSHCELVSSLGSNVNHCTGCLLACLTHSADCNARKLQHPLVADCVRRLSDDERSAVVSDNTLVRNQKLPQQHIQMRSALESFRAADKKTMSDTATLTSTDSNLDSCSSTCTQRARSTLK